MTLRGAGGGPACRTRRERWGRRRWGGAGGASSRQPGGADVRAEAQQQRTAVDRCGSGRCCGAATRQAEERPQSAAVAVGSDPGEHDVPVRGAEVEHDHRVRGWRATAAAGPAAPPREYGAVADQIDAGNYSEAYKATGSFFRESMTAEEFRDRLC